MFSFFVLRVKDARRRWWAGSLCRAVKWTWKRSAQSTKLTTANLYKRPLWWALLWMASYVAIYFKQHDLKVLFLCSVCRNTPRETTRRFCWASVDQRSKLLSLDKKKITGAGMLKQQYKEIFCFVFCYMKTIYYLKSNKAAHRLSSYL